MLGHRFRQLRESCTASDAASVALGDLLGAALITTDATLATAPSHHAPIELISAA